MSISDVIDIAVAIAPVILPSIIGIVASKRQKLEEYGCEIEISKLKELACGLDKATSKREIMEQLPLLRCSLNHKGIVGKKQYAYDRYLWEQICAVEKCNESQKMLREVKLLIDYIHLNIYEKRERKIEDKKKKIWLCLLLIGEVIAVAVDVYLGKLIYENEKETTISFMVLCYNYLPILVGVVAFYIREKKEKWKKVIGYLVMSLGIIGEMIIVLLVDYRVLNIFFSIIYGIIIFAMMELLDLSKYVEIQNDVEDYINKKCGIHTVD